MKFDPSYVALCRELRLEHKPTEGDVYLGCDHVERCAAAPHEVLIVGTWTTDNGWWPEAGDVWIPREGDWLDKLEEALAQKWLAASGAPPVAGRARQLALQALEVRTPAFPREAIVEAAARTWCAVTERAVPA